MTTQSGAASASVLLSKLEGVQAQGKGWRARCPSCGGKSRKLSVAESDGRTLVHCFAGCKGEEVLAAVGLRWADLMPPRHWPQTPGERRQASRAMRESGWAAALEVLALEASIVQIAAHELGRVGGLSADDYERLLIACGRIDDAASVLTEARR